jgi:ubiquinone biosynthesis protein
MATLFDGDLTRKRMRRYGVTTPPGKRSFVKRLRIYRFLRAQLAIFRIFPRYAWLLLRGDDDPQRWEKVHAAAAAELKAIALSLAGAFTKAAQIGGARADILPQVFIDELSQFHDAVPPRPFATLRPIVERDLGRPIDAVFESINPEAIAAASLAQVHRARLTNGDEVVVKIQYPEIRRLIPLDLSMLRLAARMALLLQRRIDMRSVISEVTRFIELELDFRREVESTGRLGEVLRGWPEAVVPRTYPEHCGDNLIVLEYLDGIQVTHTAKLVAAGHKLPEVARKIGALYGAMIFELGFFHGDPHPGNLLVLPDGRIGLLDFGLCKELPKGFARLVAQMMIAAMVGNSKASLEAASELGFDMSGLRPEHMRSLMLSMIGDSDGDNDLLDILGESQIRKIPEDFALVVRTMILLNGLSHRLAPNRRLIQAQLIQHLAAGAAQT